MSLSPQKFREIVFQLLYSQDIGHSQEDAMIELIMNELSVTKKNVKLAQDKVNEIRQKLDEIDPMIASVSTSYTFERIQTVTKNILRLGVYELFIEQKAPPKVIIAEAIRLSRKFSSPESASFANALLDHLYQVSIGNQVDGKSIEKQGEAFLKQEKASSDAALEHLSLKEEEEESPNGL
jgi:transcription antitermination protein NusB